MNMNSNYEIFPVIVPTQSSLRSINFYIVKSEDSLSLIDAGLNNEGCFNALNKQLNEMGCSISDLTDIILTHHHIDHVGLVNRIFTEQQIPVYTHPLSIPRLTRENSFLEMRVEFFSTLYSQMGCGEMGNKQVHYLKESIVKNRDHAITAALTPLEDSKLHHFDIIHTPGHAPDQIALYHLTNKWLLSGDLLISHISSNALVEPDPYGKRIHTLVEHIDSLMKCRSLQLDLVFPGHGEVIDKPEDLIQKRLDRIEEKAERLKSFINEGFNTGSAIAQHYYKNNYEKQFSLVMSEIIGFLDYLEGKREITKGLVEGVWRYSVL
ncbi:MBL fold metallo-hydrolase [Metabacillus schmidteae]|uniref:MBL fold metallo-hydrolase n=1 Tax=Metabacillus schmidteae TaxID=2730405 RepID=UPI00158E365E|nr:MBL fold metallo-hydrolase [Metabacillus schmidteae]